MIDAEQVIYKLNRGYKKGGRTGLSHGGSAGPVLKNKKVGIQIK